MPRRLSAGLLAPALALLALAPVAQAAIAQTPAGAKIAREALLGKHQLGSGWSVASPAPADVPALTCPRFRPRTDAKLETGAAASPTFQDGAGGPFVSQTAYAFATSSEEARVWKAVVRPQLLACVAAGLVGGAGAGVAWSHLWPGSPTGAYAMIGAAAMVGAGTQAPLAALALVVELTHSTFSLMVPMMVATVLATAICRHIDGYSIYSARLTAAQERPHDNAPAAT